MREDGLIEMEGEEIVDSRPRRYYRLTTAGRERLAEEAARLQAHAATALTRLALAGDRPVTDPQALERVSAPPSPREGEAAPRWQAGWRTCQIPIVRLRIRV